MTQSILRGLFLSEKNRFDLLLNLPTRRHWKKIEIFQPPHFLEIYAHLEHYTA